MSREENLMKNSIVLAMGQFLPKFIAIITSSLIVNNVSQVAFGNYEIMSGNTLNLIIPILTLQIEDGVFRYLIDADSKSARKYISTGLAYLSFAVMIAIIGFMLFSFDGFGGNLKYLIVVYAVVELLAIFIRPMARGVGQNKDYSICGIITAIVNITMSLIFIVYLKMDVVGVLISVIIADICGVIFIVYRLKLVKLFSFRLINKETFQQLLRYSIPLIPNLISWYIIALSDKNIINWVFGADAVAVYTTASKIPLILSLFYQAFSMAWTESAAKSITDKDAGVFYSKMFNMLFRVLSVGLIGLLAVSPIGFKILYKNPKYASAYQYMGLMVFSAYLNCIATFYGSFYIAKKDTKSISNTSIVAAVLNILVHIALIYWLGIYAAVISTVVAYLVLTLIRAKDIQKNYFKIKYNLRLMGLVCVIFIVSLILFYLTNTNIYALIINLMLAMVFAWFMVGDLLMNLIKTYMHKLKFK